MRPRRRSRTVYRVYNEEEYLAGADALSAGGDVPPSCERPSHGPTHGHRLQRIAGAAALTGAVGAVGGIAGLAEMRARTPAHAHVLDRHEIAQRVAPAVRSAPSRAGMSPPLHGARRRISHRRLPSRHAHVGRTRPVRVSHRSASREGAGARTTVFMSASRETSARVASTAPGASTEIASTTQGAPAEVPSTALQTPSAPATARPAAQSEFGFER
jgi:hypothetical protein